MLSRANLHAFEASRMKKTTLLIACFLLTLTLSSLAQDSKTLLLLPFEIRGKYRPIEQDRLTEILKKDIENGSKLQVKVYGQQTYMMTPEEAARLGKAEGADYVLYGDFKLQAEAKGAQLTGVNTEGQPGGSGIPQGYAGRYMVTVAGIGHGKVVEVSSGQLIAERPELLMESEYTGAVKGGAKMEQLESDLATRCANQFSRHLLEKLKEDAKR